MIRRFGDFLKTRCAQVVAGTFDPTEVQLQDLLVVAMRPVGGGPDSTVVIPHVAQTKPLSGGGRDTNPKRKRGSRLWPLACASGW